MVDLSHAARVAATNTVLFTLALHALATTRRPVLNLMTPLCRRYQLLSFHSPVPRVRRLRLRAGVQSCEVNGSFGCLTGHLHLTSLPGTGKRSLKSARYAGNASGPAGPAVWVAAAVLRHRPGRAAWGVGMAPPCGPQFTICRSVLGSASEHKIVTSCT